MEDEEELEHLLDIYNKFPVSELIIHPRVQTDYYKNTPRMESFLNALEKSKNPVVYNGDIFNKEKYQQVMKQMDVSGVMLGRGVLANPALFGEIRGTEKLSKERLWEFHERLLADYTQEMSGERNVLFKMKELWFYLEWSFTNTEKYEKKIRKAQHLSDYRLVVKQLFFEQEVR